MKTIVRATLALIILLSATSATDTHAQANAQFNNLCTEILESLQSFYAVRSTQMGIHHYDNRFTDYSSGSVKDMIKKLTDFEKKLYKYRSASLTPHERVNYRVIKSNVDIALLELKQIEWHKRSPQLYVDEAVSGIYFLILSSQAPLNERLVMIMQRMRNVPSLFETARRNLSHPPRVYIDAAIESLESGMAFYKQVAGELMNKFPERADELLKVSTAAREAMNDFVSYLTQLEPGEETGFSIGKRNFDYLLSNYYFLPYDTDSLLAVGWNLFNKANEEYKEYQLYVGKLNNNSADSIFVPATITRQDILDYYNWEVNQVRIFIENHGIVTVPENIAPVTVIETPPFLQPMVSGIAYEPAPPFDSVQQAFFYVRPIPDNLDRSQLEARFRYISRRGFKGSVVHEAYPGHHLQLQIAAMSEDPVRKWQQNLLLVEGWALYCEEMMYQNGLYGAEDPARWLAVLGGIRFRAARIIADVKLHTGEFTYDECVDWMTEVLELSSDSEREYIRKEVRRYTLTPTYQMSYLIGKEEIMHLIEAAQVRSSEPFDQQSFHDRLLAEGAIPVTLMWDILGLKRVK